MYDYDRRLAKEPVGEQEFGPFKVKYLPQHAEFVPKIGDMLLEAAKRCASAGFSITHDIQTLITGRGAAHALAIYYAQTPPTIKIAPKAYNRADLVHTLIHELGHYFHDKIVPGGFRNASVTAKYRWAVRQESVTEGSGLDAVQAKIKSLEADIERFIATIYAPPKRGTLVEFNYNWFGKKFFVKGKVGRKMGRDIEIELTDPPELIQLVQSTYRRPVLPVSVGNLVTPSSADLSKLTGMREEVTRLQQEVSNFARGEKKDNVYEVQFHDWLPTTYSKKNVMEWFAELFVTDVLGHLKPEPSAWLKSIIKGTAKATSVTERVIRRYTAAKQASVSEVIDDEQFHELEPEDQQRWKGYVANVTHETWSKKDLEVGDTADRGMESFGPFKTLEALLRQMKLVSDWDKWLSKASGSIEGKDKKDRKGGITRADLSVERKDKKPLNYEEASFISVYLRLK